MRGGGATRAGAIGNCLVAEPGHGTLHVFRHPLAFQRARASGSSDSPVRTEPGVVAAVRELVRFESKLGLNGDLVLPALANAYMVEDDAAAERLASAYPDCHFLTATGRALPSSHGFRRQRLERRAPGFAARLSRTGAANGGTGNADQGQRGRSGEAEAQAKRLDEQLKSLTGSKMEAEKKAVVADEKLRQTRESCDRTRQQLDALLSEAAVLAARARPRGGTPG